LKWNELKCSALSVFLNLVCLQTGTAALKPVMTGADGIAEIPLNVGSDMSDDDYEQIPQYAATAQTADGQLMVVDLRPAIVFTGSGTALHSEVFLDRTVVGLGAMLCRFGEQHFGQHFGQQHQNTGLFGEELCFC
jgi:hypothetical protein